MDQVTSRHRYLTVLSILGKLKDFKECHGGRYRCLQTGVSFLFFLLFGCYVPVVFLWSGIIPFENRFHVMLAVLAFYSLCIFFRRYRFAELGYTTDNLKNSICWNLVFCVFGAASLYLLYKIGLLRPKQANYLPYGYAVYVLFLAPVQEVIFRGILFAEMRRTRIVDQRFMLIISALSFSFLHLIYNYPPLLIISFVSGLIWGIIFMKWPNIWGVSISHSFLGALAMFFGVI